MLLKTQEKLEELQIAGMGKKRWMSKNSARKGVSLRAPATAKTQSSSSVRVDWTPVFARGKLLIYVVDTDTQDSSQPTKLTHAGLAPVNEAETRVVQHSKASGSRQSQLHGDTYS